ncbi:MAG: SCP2 sterol-binding domain-containing protein [Candidatus Bathyarchaeia archaeon]|jgi:putative sterol carrier protein
MEATTPNNFFQEALPARFKPEKTAGIDVIIQLILTGPSGGEWVVIVKDQKLQITKGTHPSPSLTLKASDTDFMDMVNKKLSAEKAFFTGKIKFKGNIAAALKLREAGFL